MIFKIRNWPYFKHTLHGKHTLLICQLSRFVRYKTTQRTGYEWSWLGAKRPGTKRLGTINLKVTGRYEFELVRSNLKGVNFQGSITLGTISDGGTL